MSEVTSKQMEKISKEYKAPNKLRPSPYERFRPYKEGKRGILTSK